jgi:SnoaL-like domain
MIDIAAEREAIRALIASIKYQKDCENDPVAFGNLWAKDATYVVESNGQVYGGETNSREDVVAFNVKNWAAGAHGKGDAKETHLAEPPHIVELGGGRYRAIYNLVMFGLVGGKYALVGTGLFQDDCVKEDGEWKVYARRAKLKRPG